MLLLPLPRSMLMVAASTVAASRHSSSKTWHALAWVLASFTWAFKMALSTADRLGPFPQKPPQQDRLPSSSSRPMLLLLPLPRSMLMVAASTVAASRHSSSRTWRDLAWVLASFPWAFKMALSTADRLGPFPQKPPQQDRLPSSSSRPMLLLLPLPRSMLMVAASTVAASRHSSSKTWHALAWVLASFTWAFKMALSTADRLGPFPQKPPQQDRLPSSSSRPVISDVSGDAPIIPYCMLVFSLRPHRVIIDE
uniref:Uncharacterized protein LOC116948034 n=1 Tax=Petromyzon marinus TaxID=7757 RepID=A0AAJ7TNM5_PETMA|nr:uncharacterized protein LOC116948034 [Petromyzon marinus]